MDRLLLRLLVLLAVAAAPARATVLLNGAGATFPFPLYSRWFAEFSKRAPDIQINYQPIGSGGGIGQIIAGTVDFGATDGPMTDEQLATLPVPILHLPTALGAVVITFNVNHIDRLRFDPETIAGIFLGKITNWKTRPSGEAPRCPFPTHRSPSCIGRTAAAPPTSSPTTSPR
jgi:phosphate transport system substrate-binding protein